MSKLKPITETSENLAVEAATVASTATGAPDPFDLKSLRIDPNFVETVGVKKLLTTVPVRKPNRQDFIRVHPSESYRDKFAMIELKDDREVFLVSPSIAHSLPNEVNFYNIYTAINRQGVPFLWPVRLPNADGRIIEWHTSAEDGRFGIHSCYNSRESSCPCAEVQQ